MKKYFISAAYLNLSILCLFFFCTFSFSQNLVPNPSFEQYDTCPNFYGQLNRATPWFNPSLATPDFFHDCDTTWDWSQWPQSPRTGNGLAAIILKYNTTLYREYIEIKFLNPLQAGIKYYVGFYVLLYDSTSISTDEIGAYISTDSIRGNNLDTLDYIPQISNPKGNFLNDKLNWIRISGPYIANGGEKYLTIGNFKDDNNTDTSNVGGGSAGYDFPYYFIDDINVSTDSLSGISIYDSQKNIKIFPNPASIKTNIEIAGSNQNSYNIIDLFDIVGNKVKHFENKGINTDIDCHDLSDGIYVIIINVNGQKRAIGKLIISNAN